MFSHKKAIAKAKRAKTAISGMPPHQREMIERKNKEYA